MGDYRSYVTNRRSEADPAEFEVGGDQQDALFSVLSDSRRRFTLQYLRTVDPPLPVSELTTELTAWEGHRPEASPSGGTENSIEISLVHNHLPKMAEAGIIDYDPTWQTVALADRTDEIRTHLQAMTGD